MKASGNTILITGGDSGIGREYALRLNALGNTIIVAGQDMEALMKTVEQRDMHAMVVDMGDPEAIAAFAELVIKEHPDLNVLINNADVMHREVLSRTGEPRNAEPTAVTNLLGPIRLTNALTDHFVNQPNASIVNISSGSTFVPLRGAPTYEATKAATDSYAISLEKLKSKVELIELITPAVQAEPAPGQSTGAGGHFDDYTEEIMTLFCEQPTHKETLVERVSFLRWVECDGHFDQATKMRGKC